MSRKSLIFLAIVLSFIVSCNKAVIMPSKLYNFFPCDSDNHVPVSEYYYDDGKSFGCFCFEILSDKDIQYFLESNNFKIEYNLNAEYEQWEEFLVRDNGKLYTRNFPIPGSKEVKCSARIRRKDNDSIIDSKSISANVVYTTPVRSDAPYYFYHAATYLTDSLGLDQSKYYGVPVYCEWNEAFREPKPRSEMDAWLLLDTGFKQTLIAYQAASLIKSISKFSLSNRDFEFSATTCGIAFNTQGVARRKRTNEEGDRGVVYDFCKIPIDHFQVFKSCIIGSLKEIYPEMKFSEAEMIRINNIFDFFLKMPAVLLLHNDINKSLEMHCPQKQYFSDLTEYGSIFKLKGTIFFQTGNSTLTQTAKGFIADFVNDLKKGNNLQNIEKIIIKGYASSIEFKGVAEEESNKKNLLLSQARTKSIVQELASCGLDTKICITESYGVYDALIPPIETDQKAMFYLVYKKNS
jgi:flagellar motor protein MotB